MKRASARIFQVAVVLLGVAALVFLLGEPHLEGRNAHATVFQVYFNDPFLAYAYVGSIPFFVALCQAFTLLGHLARHGTRPPTAAKSLRTIKYCALALIGFIAGGEVVILLNDSEDRAGGVFMGFLFASGAVAMAMTAAILERSTPFKS